MACYALVVSVAQDNSSIEFCQFKTANWDRETSRAWPDPNHTAMATSPR